MIVESLLAQLLLIEEALNQKSPGSWSSLHWWWRRSLDL